MQETDFYQQFLALPDLQVQSVEYTDANHALFANSKHPARLALTVLNRPPSSTSTQQGKCAIWTCQVVRFGCTFVCVSSFAKTVIVILASQFLSRKMLSYADRQTKWIVECCARQPFTEVGALLDICPKTVERLY